MEELLEKLASGTGTEKGESGRIGIVGGSIDYTGPPALSGQAALRTGSDIAKILTSREVLPIVAGYSENLVVNRYTGGHLSEDSVSKARQLGEWADVLVVGPGLGKPDEDAIQQIVSNSTIPIIVDADAIEPAIGGEFSNAIFTPDSREADSLADAYGDLESFSRESDSVVVSTGDEDVIYHGDDRWTNDTGVPGMTVAGTGDILTGITASLLAQGLNRAEAARLGAWTIGVAGEFANGEYGDGLMATDIIERIPKALGKSN